MHPRMLSSNDRLTQRQHNKIDQQRNNDNNNSVLVTFADSSSVAIFHFIAANNVFTRLFLVRTANGLFLAEFFVSARSTRNAVGQYIRSLVSTDGRRSSIHWNLVAIASKEDPIHKRLSNDVQFSKTETRLRKTKAAVKEWILVNGSDADRVRFDANGDLHHVGDFSKRILERLTFNAKRLLAEDPETTDVLGTGQVGVRQMSTVEPFETFG